MNDGLDYKKIESCMVEIYGQSGYNETSNTFLLYNKIRYITASGIPILMAIPSDSVVDTATEAYCSIALYINYLNGHSGQWKRGIADASADGSTHMNMIVWSIGLYITKYKIEIKEETFNEYLLIIDKFLQNTKMCRVTWSGWSINEEGNLKWKTERKDNGELNIETYHSLTDSQRRVILDIIKVSGVSPNNIFIDDNSDEQLVKRQLRLQFF